MIFCNQLIFLGYFLFYFLFYLFRPPHPGMIAWIQYRHKLDLSKCLFIDSDENESVCGELASSIGISYSPASLFFKTNSWNIKSKM